MNYITLNDRKDPNLYHAITVNGNMVVRSTLILMVMKMLKIKVIVLLINVDINDNENSYSYGDSNGENK